MTIIIFARRLLSIALFQKVTFSMILISIILLSVISLGSLSVELMPNISYGTITIFNDVRGGMPSSDVERLVTKPIEQAMSRVMHLKNIISSSKRNKSVVTLEFDTGIDMNTASLDVREKFLQIKDTLPKQIEKPIIARYEESDVPVIILAFTSDRKTSEELRLIVEKDLKDRLMRVDGVANVEISGGRARKIIANIDENRLAAYKISMNEVVHAIEQNNINMLVGQMDDTHVSFGLRTVGSFTRVTEIAKLGIKVNNDGSIVRLEDLGEISDSYMEAETYTRLNSQEAVTVYVQKETNANTINAAAKIQKVLNKFEKTLTEDINMVIISNQAERIIDSIESIKKTMFFGMMLVIVILAVILSKHIFTKGLAIIVLATYFFILFLSSFTNLSTSYMTYFVLMVIFVFSTLAFWYRDYRPSFFIALTMPISLLITISLMYIGKVSINIMSLSGLVLGIGLLVDNSIVVVENYLHEKELNPDAPYTDTITSSSLSMIEPIVGSTLTTVVVFLSFSFLEKRMQLLYADIAFSVTASLFSSLFCALGVIPFLMALYQKKPMWYGRRL
ncbi:efflux RND transporter permease subunit, partial [bacterium]